jgi:hypothetical protein
MFRFNARTHLREPFSLLHLTIGDIKKIPKTKRNDEERDRQTDVRMKD